MNMKQQLRENICVVTFRKKNGQLRVMRCTLKQDYINENNLSPVGGGYTVPDHQIRCVDVDLNEWRSFTVDSVISFEIEK